LIDNNERRKRIIMKETNKQRKKQRKKHRKKERKKQRKKKRNKETKKELSTSTAGSPKRRTRIVFLFSYPGLQRKGLELSFYSHISTIGEMRHDDITSFMVLKLGT